MMPLAARSLLLDITRAGDRLVAVGERGHALVSVDNGASFTQKQTPTRATLTAVYFVDANRGWAVGHDAVIIHTSDGGETWTIQHWDPELEKPFLDVMFLDARRGFSVGAYGLFRRTTDGGQTWEEVENDVTMNEWHFTAMTRLNNGALMIAGEAGGMALSRDEGESWVQLESPYEGSFFGVLPWGARGALVFGLRGNVFASQTLPQLPEAEDAETSDSPTANAAGDAEDEESAGDENSSAWTHLSSDTLQSFMGGALLPNGQAALVGVNGTIVVVDKAHKVSRIRNDVTVAFSAVIPPAAGSLLVVGEGGTNSYKY